MSPTGPKYPSTVVDAHDARIISGSYTPAWTNPNNVKALDGSYAYFPYTQSTGYSSDTDTLTMSGYGFSIPSTAIIDGIVVAITRYGTQANDEFIKLTKAGTLVGSNLSTGATVPTSVAQATYGGATNLWGTTWTASDINNSGFGVACSFGNTHDPADSSMHVDAISITVYWHTAPADVPQRHLYKVFDRKGIYLGNLPNVKSPFAYSQDINTAGTTIRVECAISPDIITNQYTNFTEGDYLFDETGDRLLDELGVPLLDEAFIDDVLVDHTGDPLLDSSGNPLLDSRPQIIEAVGNSPLDVIIKNGNKVQVWEYNYYYPNGKCMALGEINRWEASFGGGGGSGGAATSDTSADSISVLIYTDGQDMDNYLVRSNPYTLTEDQTQEASNTFGTITLADKGAAYEKYGQSWTVGSGVTNLAAVVFAFYGTATVTVDIYDSIAMTNLIGSITQNVNAIPEISVQFSLPNSVTTIPGSTLFGTISVGAGQSISVVYQNTDNYGGGSAYHATYGGGGGGGFDPITADLYFKTYSGTGATTGTFTSADPTTGMLVPALDDYIGRGGLISYTPTSIEATGLSLNYKVNTNTTYELAQAALTLSPDGFYYYVDLGTDILYFQQTSDTPNFVLTKGKHLDQITIIATIENIKNQAFLSGGVVAGANIYVTEDDPASIALYGPRLDRLSDTGILDAPTGAIVAASDVSELKDEQYQTTITVVYKTMDITLFRPGHIIGLNGFNSFVDNLSAQVVRIDYTPEEATLTLGIIPRRQTKAFEQVTRGLIAQQTVANPSSPS